MSNAADLRDDLETDYDDVIADDSMTATETSTVESAAGSDGLSAEDMATLVATAPEGSAETVKAPKMNGAPAKAEPGAVHVTELTDDATAAAFVSHIVGRWRYVPQTRRWYQAEGHLWTPDDSGMITEEARSVLRRLECDDHEEKEFRSFRKSALSRSGINNTIGLAASDQRVVTHVDQLDSEPYHLSTPDGVIDLHTGEWITPDDTVMHTRTTACAPDFDMPTPLLDRFMRTTFGGDQDLIRYVQTLLGYAATGDVGEHLLPFLYGGGRNGKSQLMDLASYVLGEYAGSTPAGFLVKQRNQGHPTEIMDLQGKRLVTVSELNDGDQLDEAKVKMLVGEKRIKARAMGKDFVEFAATHHLWMLGNHQPEVTGGGRSIWERIRLIPFVHTVPPEDRIRDIGTKIATEEGPGVLAWLIEGARRALAEGIQTPESVKAATAEYERDSDPLKRFIEECCSVSTNDTVRVPQKEFVSEYEAWCQAEGEVQLGQNKLTRELKKRWGIQTQSREGARYYTRVAIVT